MDIAQIFGVRRAQGAQWKEEKRAVGGHCRQDLRVVDSKYSDMTRQNQLKIVVDGDCTAINSCGSDC